MGRDNNAGSGKARGGGAGSGDSVQDGARGRVSGGSRGASEGGSRGGSPAGSRAGSSGTKGPCSHSGEGLWKEGLRELSGLGLRRDLPPASYHPAAGDAAGKLTLCSNDYLALSCDERLKRAAIEALDRAGCGSTGSRLLSGNSSYHMELESALRDFTGYDACILFSSGYHANVGGIPIISKGMRAIFSDELNHASIIDGCRLSKTETVKYRHCDPSHLDYLLAEAGPGAGGGAVGSGRARGGGPVGGRGASKAGPGAGFLVITEGVFSMDGDVAPLSELAAVTRNHGATLMVDDAHGFGVLGESGRGTPEAGGLSEGVDIYLATMGKALGSMGGFIAGSMDLIAYLMSTARAFMYSTALPPAVCAAGLAALDIVKSEPGRRDRLRALSLALIGELGKRGINTGAGASHIVPVMAPGEGVALELASRLESRGYLTRAIRYPTVARGKERLRLSLRCDFSEEQVRALAAALAEEGSDLGLAGGGYPGPGRR